MERITPTVWLLRGQESPRDLRGLAARLRSRGWNVGRLDLTEAADEGAAADRIRWPNPGFGWWKSLAIRRLACQHEADRPDLLHAADLGAAPIALALAETWRRPYILTVDQFPGEQTRLRLSRRWCRAIEVPCEGLATVMNRAFGLPPALLATIRPGLEIPADLPETAPFEPGRVPIVGLAVPRCGDASDSTFLEAARLVLDSGRDVEFVVSTPTTAMGRVRQHAAHLGITDRLTFEGQPRPTAHFRGLADLICVLSTGPDVGLGLGAALASCRPTIVSRVPGLVEWVDPGRTGIVVPPGDPRALAAAMTSILDHPEQARQRARAAQDWIRQRHDPDREAAELALLYERTVAAAQAATPTPRPTGPLGLVRRRAAV